MADNSGKTFKTMAKMKPRNRATVAELPMPSNPSEDYVTPNPMNALYQKLDALSSRPIPGVGPSPSDIPTNGGED